MITPLEIENKEFSRSIRGYNADEVDEFLDLIILDLQELLDEKEKLVQENRELKEENEEHKKSQVSVMHTLDSAKKLMKDISESAEKRADIIIRNAKLDAEMILRDAQASLAEDTQAKELKARVDTFRSRFRQMLQEEMDSLDGKSGSLLEDLEKEFSDPASITDQLPDAEDDVIIVQRKDASEEKAAEEIMDQIKRDLKTEPTYRQATDTKVVSSPVVPKKTVVLDEEAIDRLLEQADTTRLNDKK